MSAIDKIATRLGARNDVPNQELARELAANNDTAGIRELVDHFADKDKAVQSDCIKAVYETGYLKPELIADYVEDYIALLDSKNNRMVWGAMIALSTVAHLRPKEIFTRLQRIIDALNDGSVITVDGAVKALAGVAASGDEYRRKILPVLFECLRTCRAKSVPQYSEAAVIAVDPVNSAGFVKILVDRDAEYSDSQRARVMKVIKKAQKKTDREAK